MISFDLIHLTALGSIVKVQRFSKEKWIQIHLVHKIHAQDTDCSSTVNNISIERNVLMYHSVLIDFKADAAGFPNLKPMHQYLFVTDSCCFLVVHSWSCWVTVFMTLFIPVIRRSSETCWLHVQVRRSIYYSKILIISTLNQAGSVTWSLDPCSY